MSSEHFHTHEWAKRHRKQRSTRNTHQDALTDREFERLIEGCDQLDTPADHQTQFVCLMAGRLGLRAGEITHLQSDWIDWDRKLIDIAKHEPCDCGCCRRQAKQEVDYNNDLAVDTAMGEALDACDVPHALVVLKDDDHFLNRAESRRRRHEAELAFYKQVFGFEAVDALPEINLSSSEETYHLLVGGKIIVARFAIPQSAITVDSLRRMTVVMNLRVGFSTELWSVDEQIRS